MLRRRLSLVVMCALVSAVTPSAAAEPAVPNDADEFTYPIEGRLTLPDRSPLPTTALSLNGGQYETMTRRDGSFIFHDVAPGVYLLDVLSANIAFSQVKISLPASPVEKVRCLEYKFPGAQKVPIAYPLHLAAHAKMRYFEKREQIGLHTFFKNPMSYMMVVTVAVVVFMPKMMANMDKDQLKEMQEQMEGNDPQAMLQNLLGGGAAGKKGKDDD